jgi:hypothetical protein
MDRVIKHCFVVLIFLINLTLFFACGDAPYQGGKCATTVDCISEHQNVPGSICQDERCICPVPGEAPCCARGTEEPGCFIECRPCGECAGQPVECPRVETGAGGFCESDLDCPGPPDVLCGAGRCVDGKCEVEIVPGTLESQVRGDCVRLECTRTGEVIEVEDQSDTYDDGNQCTADLCDHRTPHSTFFENIQCPTSGAGRCHDGECVQCLDTDPTMVCTGGLACDGTLCVPGHCVNGTRDVGLGETGFNCGGECRPCQPSDRCADDTDCISGICDNTVCTIPTCEDHVKNGPETGVDCGAPSCPLCPQGEGCRTGENCTSGVCWAGVCEAASCHDAVQNGGELGVDCGSQDCPAPCPR